MGKSIFSIIAVMIVTASIISIAAVSAEDTETSFVVLGDSIASGYGVSAEQSYAYIVADNMGYTLANDAVEGYDTSNLMDQLSNDAKVIDDVKNAGIIEISIGGNDFLGQYMTLMPKLLAGDTTAIEEIMVSLESNFKEIITTIKQQNPDATVIVQTLYNPFYDEKRALVEWGIDTINGIFTDCLQENPDEYVIADVADSFSGDSSLIANDSIHPSVEGHSKIAEVICALPCVTTNKSFVLFGDINDDAVINSKDSLIIKQFIANFEVTINKLAADVNCDNNINSKDSLLLKQYVASWNVILGK